MSAWRYGLAALLLAELFLLFWLPLHVPVTPVYAESYSCGFNNRAADAVLALFVLTAYAAARAFGIGLPQARPTAPEQPGRRSLHVALLLAFVTALFFAWFTRPANGVGDGAYFLDRIHLLAEGRRPFLDFEWVYGSSSLYASLALERTLHLLPIDAYSLLWVIETVAGVVLLWWGLRWLEVGPGKTAVFWLYFAMGFLMIPGVVLNYVLLRYSLALFCVTAWVHADRDNTPVRRAAGWLLGACSLAVLLAVSPEEGLAYAASTFVFLVLRRHALGRPFTLDAVCLGASFAAELAYVNRHGLFTSLKSFGSGASNLPVVPGLPVLLLLVILLTAVAIVAGSRWRTLTSTNVAHCLLFAAAMLPGMLGRADAVHIGAYGITLFCSVLPFLHDHPRLWRAGCAGFLLAFVIVPLLLTGRDLAQGMGKLVLLHVYKDGVPDGALAARIDAYATRRARQTLGPEQAAYKMAAMRRANETSAFDPHTLFPGSSAVLFAPAAYRPNKFSIYQAPSIDEGYFDGLVNTYSSRNVQSKIDELRQHPERDLLMSREGFAECSDYLIAPSALRRLLQSPIVPTPQRPVAIREPLCRYIEGNYHWQVLPTAAQFGYGLMRHN